MIGNVTRAIVQALQDARKGTPFAAAEIRAQAGGEEAPAGGVTVLLVGAAIDHAMRTPPVRVGPTAAGQAVILHYVITPWIDAAPEQHDALGWLLRTVHSGPVLTASGGPVRLNVATLTLEAEAQLWRALHPGRPLVPSLHVEARSMLAISP